MPRFSQAVRLAFTSAAFAAALPALASPFSDINAAAAAGPIRIVHVRGPIHMLSGSGGNIGVLSGRDGLLMIDAGIALSEQRIQAALSSIGSGRVRYLINTHWHWDHTDGNVWLRRAGATILADPIAVRRLTQTNRIVEWEHTFTPIAKASLPNEMVSGDRTIRFDGENLLIRHYRPGHTDGDMSAYFAQSNVLQTGDTFWNGMYPFIDYATGGSIDGAIRAINTNLAMAQRDTLVIPGHGPLGSRSDMVAFRDMLVAIRGKVAALKAQGRSADQVVAAHPTAAFDATWGRSVISGALFTRLVYRGV